MSFMLNINVVGPETINCKTRLLFAGHKQFLMLGNVAFALIKVAWPQLCEGVDRIVVRSTR